LNKNFIIKDKWIRTDKYWKLYNEMRTAFVDHGTFNGHEDAVKMQWPEGYAEIFIHSRAIIKIVMEIIKNYLEWFL